MALQLLHRLRPGLEVRRRSLRKRERLTTETIQFWEKLKGGVFLLYPGHHRKPGACFVPRPGHAVPRLQLGRGADVLPLHRRCSRRVASQADGSGMELAREAVAAS